MEISVTKVSHCGLCANGQKKSQNCSFSILFLGYLHNSIFISFVLISLSNSAQTVYSKMVSRWLGVCFPFRPYLSLCLISLIIFEPSLRRAFVALIWTTYALNQQLSYLTAQMGTHISNAIRTCLTHVAPTDVRMARVTLEVCFSLPKYFCGEAISLLGFCGRGVCFWALLVCAFLAEIGLDWGYRRRRGKIGEFLENERRSNFGKNGDQRRGRWRKTLLDDISVSEGEMKILRGEQRGKGQEVKGIVVGDGGGAARHRQRKGRLDDKWSERDGRKWNKLQ